jgi:hypothetical protein
MWSAYTRSDIDSASRLLASKASYDWAALGDGMVVDVSKANNIQNLTHIEDFRLVEHYMLPLYYTS